MITASVRAGLLPAGLLEGMLHEKIARVDNAYLDNLDEQERSKASCFLARARSAADQPWEDEASGRRGGFLAPKADVTYEGDDAAAVQQSSSDIDDDRGRIIGSPHVHRELCRLQDVMKLRGLEATLRN